MTNYEKNLIKQSPMLKKYAFKLTKNEDKANDLVQDTLLRAILKKHLFKNGSNLQGWLITLMKNLFLNQLSFSSRFISKDNIDFEELYSFITTKKVAYNQGLSNLSLEFINTLLKDIDKTNLEMFLLMTKGFKYKELAEIFDIPLGTVKFKLSITKKQLRDKLINLGYENSKT